MHDMIGSAGMLRGWVSMWTMQLLWGVVAITLAVGVVAMGEYLNGVFLRVRGGATRSRHPLA